MIINDQTFNRSNQGRIFLQSFNQYNNRNGQNGYKNQNDYQNKYQNIYQDQNRQQKFQNQKFQNQKFRKMNKTYFDEIDINAKNNMTSKKKEY